MRKNKIKGLYDYFETEEKSIDVPPIEKITAYKDFDSLYAPPETKRRAASFTLRRTALIAACLALAVAAAAVVPAIINNGPANGGFSAVEYTSGVADWYSPGCLEADLLSLGVKNHGITPISITVRPVANTLKGELPEWIYGADTLDEKYLRLYGYDDKAKEAGFAGYLIYDIKNAEMIDLTSLIYDHFKAHVYAEDSDYEPTRVIGNITFGGFGDYCVFDYIHTDYIMDEAGEAAIPVDANERYLMNIASGDLRRIPMRDILAVSDDGERIVNCAEIDGEFTVFVYETSYGRETAIPVGYRAYTVFANGGKTIIFYAPQTLTGENSGWDTVNASWKLYDVGSGSIFDGRGRIVRLTENGDAVVVRDQAGGKVLKLSDLSDVTGEYELETYEKYEVEKRLDNGIYSFFAAPLFDGDEVLIADNIEAWTEWGEYYYIRQYGSESIVVYSTRENKAFDYDVSSLDIPRNYDGISIYVTDEGRKCRIVTYADPGRVNVRI